MKRKGKLKKAAEILPEPNWTEEEKERQQAKKIKVPKTGRQLKNNHSTRVVIPAENSPSGTRYDFGPKQSHAINANDINYLLSLKRKGSVGCCGGAGSVDSNYFEEV